MGPGAPGRPGTPGFPGRPEGPELPGLPCPWGPGRKRMKSLESKTQILELQNHSEVKLVISHKNPTVSPKLSQHVFVFSPAFCQSEDRKHFAAIKVIILMILWSESSS